jgi:hypothetical protein
MRFPHIQADDLDRRRAASAQGGEKPDQGLPRAIFSHPEQYPALQVVDHGQVVMPFTAAHLIDA